jgi:uncharacterized protein (TIGR00730 family)
VTGLHHFEIRPVDGINICVYCSSSDGIEQFYWDLATEVGSEIGRRGHTLVSGGGSVSCMGALAEAARASGARTIGVIPQALLEAEVADLDADQLLVTTTMRERKQLMDEKADGFLALPGGLGTLEELLEVWASLDLGMHTKPVVVLDPDHVFGLVRSQINELVSRGFVRAAARDAVRWAGTVSEALDLIEAGAAKSTSRNEPFPVTVGGGGVIQ